MLAVPGRHPTLHQQDIETQHQQIEEDPYHGEGQNAGAKVRCHRDELREEGDEEENVLGIGHAGHEALRKATTCKDRRTGPGIPAHPCHQAAHGRITDVE